MDHRIKNVILGDVDQELYSKYDNPIVCARNSPVIEGFVPTSFTDLSSVISSVGLVLNLTDEVDNLVLSPIKSFRSDWKYYGVQYGLDLINDFSDLIISPCIFASKLMEYLKINSIVVASGRKDSIMDQIREDFIFEYLQHNHPECVVKRLKIS